MKMLLKSLLATSCAGALLGCGPETASANDLPAQAEFEVIAEDSSALERRVESDVPAFEALLLNGNPDLTVRRLLPEEETAGATIFPPGPAFRFWVQPRDYGHDGWQISVSGDELRIRETYAGLSGTHLAEVAPVQLEHVVRETYADLEDNIRAARAGVYVVKAEDTLARIAREFGTTVEALVQLNALTTEEVRSGQKLNVPRFP